MNEYASAFPEMAWDMGYLTHLCFHPHLIKPTKAEWTLREKQSWTTRFLVWLCSLAGEAMPIPLLPLGSGR